MSTSGINVGVAIDQVNAGYELNQGNLGIVIHTRLLLFDLREQALEIWHLTKVLPNYSNVFSFFSLLFVGFGYQLKSIFLVNV